MSSLSQTDPEISRAIDLEGKRQRETINLIASENYASRAVLEAQGSFLTDKYAEGYPGKRYYGGCQNMDTIETLAIERAKKLFHAGHANVQPHSGAQANMAAYYALLEYGDTVLGMDLSHGGHLTHGSKASFSGKSYNFISYGLEPETERIDYPQLEKMALKHKPKLIVAGATAYPRIIDFERFRRIADMVGAKLMVDMAHIAGMVAVGLHPTPVPYAHVVTSTTHKTLRGPRGGFMLCDADLARTVDAAVFPEMQGGPLMHVIAAKAVAFKEALEPGFKEYQQQVVKNARAMAKVFIERGYDVVSGGTDDHLFLVSFIEAGLTGKDVDAWLGDANITINKNSVPNDPQSPFVTSGIRVGTPAVTTRGFTEADCIELAGWMCDVIDSKGDAATIEAVKIKVLDICKRLPVYS
jgi:glycine hydroxymethyltransferase